MSSANVNWEKFPPFTITSETLDGLRNFQMRDDDIVLASYPKTGTNWLLEIVSKILKAAGKTERSSDDMFSIPLEAKVPIAPKPGYAMVAEMPSPRVLATHLPIELAPPGIAKPQKKVKVLVPMRNPKDTAVSMFHFLNNILKKWNVDMTVPWEDLAQDFIEGKVRTVGDYCDHLLGWWQMRDDPHFLFLKYEDMKKDLLSAVKTIVAFLEVELDDSTINGIADACTFNNMKAELENTKIPERKVNVRKGIVGDWKNMFSPEQSKAFDAWYEKKLGGTGIAFDFE